MHAHGASYRMTPDPKRCSNRFNRFEYKSRSSMLNIDGPPENSSDLERAPGARSIGEEFSGGPSIVHHLQQCENARFSHSRCTFWDLESCVMGFLTGSFPPHPAGFREGRDPRFTRYEYPHLGCGRLHLPQVWVWTSLTLPR